MKPNRPHPVALIVCLLGISALFAGCETFAHFDKRRSAAKAKQVEVFRTNTKPPAKVQELGVVSEEGAIGDQREIEARFISRALKAGADALIYEPVVKIGEEVKFFSPSDTYLYKATMVAYAK